MQACTQKYLYNLWSEVLLFHGGCLVWGAQEIWFGTLSVVCGSLYLCVQQILVSTIRYMLPTQDKTVQSQKREEVISHNFTTHNKNPTSYYINKICANG